MRLHQVDWAVCQPLELYEGNSDSAAEGFYSHKRHCVCRYVGLTF